MAIKIDRLIIPKPVEKKLAKFPQQIRKKFWSCLDKLLANPFHPSLRNKRIQGAEKDWEFSITMNYRATYRIEGKDLVITNVGKHEDVF